MANIHPIKLKGDWFQGYALDIHTLKSTFIGHDEYGREVFETKRSEIGEMLYQLKYKSEKSSLEQIIATTVQFMNEKWPINKTIQGIIPVPPSKTRAFQPVIQVAKGISVAIQVPLITNFLVKIKQTPELKNVYNYQDRLATLSDAFTVKNSSLAGKNVLFFDDLFRSGATFSAITKTLYEKG